MGGMPLLEVGNWLHQVTGLYLTAIPLYFYLNNFLGPKVMEPVFTRDFLISQFDKIASQKQQQQQQQMKVVATAGKVPQLPKQFFTRAGVRGRAAGLMAFGAMSLFRPKQQQ